MKNTQPLRGGFMILLFTIALPALLPGQGQTASLPGKWECKTDEGVIRMEIKSANQIVYDGEELDCLIEPGVIKVADDLFGYIEYPYVLMDDQLTVAYPEGYMLIFNRVKKDDKPGSKPDTGSGNKNETAGGSDAGLVKHFSGVWATYTKYTETRFRLAPNGEYQERYTASYGGDGSESQGDWGVAGESHSQGTWTVSGTKMKGTITINHSNGNQTVYEYQVHQEKGEIYWREYWMNGSLYSKEGE